MQITIKNTFHSLTRFSFFCFFIMVLCYTTSVFAEEEEAADADVDNTKYFELSPPFVVNLQTNERRMRFLQVRLQVLGTPEAIEEVQNHNAPLRDIIITTLSQQTRESVNTPKKKKMLQDKVQAEVEAILKKFTGKKQIEALYFTNFVIQ